MTEEKRYYTPTEGEFRVGFDYEEFVKGEGWMPRTLSSLSEDPTLNQKGFCIDFPDDFRVKCLDKEDIEAEGWETGGNNIYSIFKLRYAYHLIPSPFDANKWEIRCTQPSWRHGHFMGQILNRSELKFQMKRLGIV